VRIEVQHGARHLTAWLEVNTRGDRRITLDIEDQAIHVCLDENHTTALALALQAAVAEIQARAVSR
jgi:hypothetical protein